MARRHLCGNGVLEPIEPSTQVAGTEEEPEDGKDMEHETANCFVHEQNKEVQSNVVVGRVLVERAHRRAKVERQEQEQEH